MKHLAPITASALLMSSLVLAGPVLAEDMSSDAIVKALQGPLTRSAKPCVRGERRDIDTIRSQQNYAVELIIEFQFNSAVVIPGGNVDALGTALRNPRLACHDFLLAGHTDGVGGDQYNLKLSERRAAAVRAYLAEKFSVMPSHLEAKGYGKSQLRNPAQPDAAENRRVEIVNLTAKTDQ